MKYILLIFIFIAGCSDKDLCETTKGFHAFYGAYDVECSDRGFEESGLFLCERMCNSYAQDYSQVLQYSLGTCICDNSEGHKVAEGYQQLLNKRKKK